MSQTYMLNLDTFKARPAVYGDRDEPIRHHYVSLPIYADADGEDLLQARVEVRWDAVGDIGEFPVITAGEIRMPNGHVVRYGSDERINTVFLFLMACYQQSGAGAAAAETAREVFWRETVR